MRALRPAVLAMVALAFALAACNGDRSGEVPPPTTGLSPEEEMTATLSSLVESQSMFYEDHGRFADETGVLMERYDFRPVGDATVVINFQGTEPQTGYLAVAQHPVSPVRCQVQHSVPAPGDREVAGQVVCAAS